MKQIAIVYLLFLSLVVGCLKSQTCSLDTFKNIRLFYLVSHVQNCKKIAIAKYCLKYKNSRYPGYLSAYIAEPKFILEIPKEKNSCRMERFAALYYVHHILIFSDTSQKKIIRLKYGNDYIEESYLNRGYSSESEKNQFIHHDMEESKKDDPVISLYYKIIKKYINDYKKHGELKAKENYLASMKKNEMEWQYDYNY